MIKFFRVSLKQNFIIYANRKYTLGQLLSVPAALLTPIFAARWGHGRAIWVGTLGVALALLPFALVPHWQWWEAVLWQC